MIESRKKNQDAVNKIIDDYVLLKQSYLQPPASDIIEKERYKSFLKYFAKNIMPRMEQDDCFFVDFLEDIERMK